MTGLLVVRELYPEATSLNSVPVSHVVRLFFQHEQSSDLRIQSTRGEIGYLHLQARPPTKPQKREMDLHGNVALVMPNGGQQRLSWAGRVEMNSRFDVERFHVDLATMEPSQRLDIKVDLLAKTAVFGVKMGEELLNETTVTLDDAGFSALMAKARINPAMVQQLKSAGGGMPGLELNAQTSSLLLGGERLSTYLLTLKAGSERIIEAHVSQLGQVLSAQAPLLGFKLTPQSLSR
jgi:hypothetical protein